MGWAETEMNGVHAGGTSISTSDMILVPQEGWGVMVLTSAANYPSPHILDVGDGV